MRSPRIKEPDAGYYHVISRIVDRRHVVHSAEKERFTGLMRAAEGFSGAAMGGCREGREGIRALMGSEHPQAHWNTVAGTYRVLLYEKGVQRVAATGDAVRPGFSREQVRAVEQTDGQLALGQLLRCRVRYFTDGAILGGKLFVEEAFRRHSANFGHKRTTGARAMVGAWGGLCTARRLRLNVITVPRRC